MTQKARVPFVTADGTACAETPHAACAETPTTVVVSGFEEYVYGALAEGERDKHV